MKNFIFISPNFPVNYWHFCRELQRNGLNVLGIGDQPYDELSSELKSSLHEYYRVGSLENYEEVYRAVAFFIFKYGRIDWLESNNEYWLEQDARLRTDFHITTGVNVRDVTAWKSKSSMKPLYIGAGVPTARQHRVSTLEAAEAFLSQVDYPVIVKPDIGVGASNTYKLENDDDLRRFYASLPTVPYVMEEFVEGDIWSYDVITDSNAQPLFESATVWPPSIMDIVNKKLDLSYYTAAEVPEELQRLGRATVQAFGVKSRFAHLEFFRLTKARRGLGEIGNFVGLEVNMRPAGGYTPDMMNFAHSTDVYQIWADMVTSDRRVQPDHRDDHYCVYASRRDCYTYLHTHEEILQRYGSRVVMCERMPDSLSGAMGNQMYTAQAYSLEEVQNFIAYVHGKV